MLSDWCWPALWVRSATCLGAFDIATCIPPGQQFLDTAASWTYHNTRHPSGKWTGTAYTGPVEFGVTYGEDVVCVLGDGANGNVCQKDVTIQLSDFDFVVPDVQAFGGIFGLAPVLERNHDEATFPASYQMWLDGRLGPQLGFHSCMELKSKETCGGGDMHMMLGGSAGVLVYDPEVMVYHNVTTSPCVTLGIKPAMTNFWAIPWTGFWIDGQEIGAPSRKRIATSGRGRNSTTKSISPSECDTMTPVALMDEGSEGNGAPMTAQAYQALVSLTNATLAADQSVGLNRGDQLYYTVACQEAASFPILTYELSGKQNVTVEPAQYVAIVPAVGGSASATCYLNVRVWDRAKSGPGVFFGIPFFAKLYVLLDYENLTVGLASLNKELLSVKSWA